MAEMLNRNGDRLRKVLSAKPKKFPETEALFANLAETVDRPLAPENPN